jgi:hypothetical protein
VLAVAFFSDSIRAMGAGIDFELILPYALGAIRSGGTAGLSHLRPAGSLHGQLCGHRERRATLLRQRHLQALHPPQCPAQNLRPPQLHQFARGHRYWRPDRMECYFGERGRGVDRLRTVGGIYRVQRAQVVLVAIQRLRLLLGEWSPASFRH